ncbi:MAG: hypothetical protein C0200_00070 [Thermoproteota archaeon]|nr:MAG: hypothetical protein C0200_00070 [Candidatus Korarchaeota archaeon]
MKVRGIDRAEVVSCITNPDKIEKLDETFRAVKKADNKVLVVLCRMENAKMIIITAYSSSKVHKYLE